MKRSDRRDERFALRLSRAEKLALEEIATQRDLSVAQVIRHAVRQILNRERGEAVAL